ncbi:uncharacterized protein LOC142083168 [Calonectris borealis]|uniref:uncharacterized protein LOC142083168 n=1 Tax=Calonectris borealis TaxID=1323832 RepID=UPI003F4B6CA1
MGSVQLDGAGDGGTPGQEQRFGCYGESRARLCVLLTGALPLPGCAGLGGEERLWKRQVGSKCQGFFPSACCDAVSQIGSVPTPGVRVLAGSLPELPARQVLLSEVLREHINLITPGLACAKRQIFLEPRGLREELAGPRTQGGSSTELSPDPASSRSNNCSGGTDAGSCFGDFPILESRGGTSTFWRCFRLFAPHLAALPALLHSDASAVGMNNSVAPVLKLHCVSSSTWGIYSLAGRDPKSTESSRALRASPASMAMGAQRGRSRQQTSLSGKEAMLSGSWYPFSFPSHLRNTVLRASGSSLDSEIRHPLADPLKETAALPVCADGIGHAMGNLPSRSLLQTAIGISFAFCLAQTIPESIPLSHRGMLPTLLWKDF